MEYTYLSERLSESQTPWSTVLVKLIVDQLKKFPAFYGIRWSINSHFTTGRHWTLFSVKWIQFAPMRGYLPIRFPYQIFIRISGVFHALRVPLISYTLTYLFKHSWVKSTNNEASQYEIFSSNPSLPSPPALKVQIFSSIYYSQHPQSVFFH
jgi:hypothetical protein